VLTFTFLGLLLIAGVRLWPFAVLILVVLLALTGLAILSPYRLHRLTSFLNPWLTPYGSGYQLTQSLIAFGRGGILGTGLGNSVQKLFYLPEAHTDFLFAVLGEELGLIGELVVLGLFSLLVGRCLYLASRCLHQQAWFRAYLSAGLGLWFGLQAFVNIGVNIGLLPTKGLTLPFISYGGSSMLINCVVIGILLRLSHETAHCFKPVVRQYVRVAPERV
jgi:cell division protein FtsW